MDEQQVKDLLNAIIAEIEIRSKDKRFGRTDHEAFLIGQTAGIVRMEARLAGVEL